MTANNHALVGALIGLSIGNPIIALPVAFASHFVLDALPHYDPPGGSKLARMRSRRFEIELIIQTALCVVLVGLLAASHTHHWVVAALCAFAATSPDLFWISGYVAAKKKNKLIKNTDIFLRFHSWVQWRTGPELLWFEAICFVGLSLTLYGQL